MKAVPPRHGTLLSLYFSKTQPDGRRLIEPLIPDGAAQNPRALFDAMRQPTSENGIAPTEIKAQAIALHAMGYSCRNIEIQLPSMYIGAKIPNYATNSRCVRYV